VSDTTGDASSAAAGKQFPSRQFQTTILSF